MGEINFIKLVIGLGVPGLALGLFYLLFKRLKIEVPKSYAGPFAILFLVIVGVITFTALIGFDDGPRSTPADNNEEVVSEIENVADNDSIKTKEGESVDIKEPEPDNPTPAQANLTADSFTFNAKLVSSDPVPVIRATIMNRSGSTQLIMGAKIRITHFDKKKDIPSAVLLQPLDTWPIGLPGTKGVFEYETDQAVVLPNDSPVSIDLAFFCEARGEKFNPGDYGQYVFHIGFMTDSKYEIKYEEEIKFL